LTIRPHDPGTYFVTSESEPESEIEYLVDWTERTCTCPVYMDFTKEPHTNGTWCKHLSAVCEYLNPPKRVAFTMSGILGMSVQGQNLDVKTVIGRDGKKYDAPF
jgi:hypothetical protein